MLPFWASDALPVNQLDVTQRVGRVALPVARHNLHNALQVAAARGKAGGMSYMDRRNFIVGDTVSARIPYKIQVGGIGDMTCFPGSTDSLDS